MATNPLSDSSGSAGGLPRQPLHLLVTAGPTREKIDAVRDWGNIFTGGTGLDLALAFLELGNVTLLTSNHTHAREYDGYSGQLGMMGVETFQTHAQLRELLAERMQVAESSARVDVVAMTAAVSDYRPAGVYRIVSKEKGVGNAKRETRNAKEEVWVVEEVSRGGGEGKVKSVYEEIAVVGERTEKLIDLFRGTWGYKGLLIKFKLEVGLTDEALIEVAGASRVASGADLMVANTLEMARPKDGSEGAAYLIGEGAPEKVARGALARRLVAWIAWKREAANHR